MLNISGLSEGIVLDHIKAGKSLDIYYQLGLNKLDSQIAIIKNAHSQKMGRKDIIKVEGDVLDRIDLDVLGYIDHSITVNIIGDSKIVEKQCDSLQESALHYFDRAGASAYLLSLRSGARNLSLPLL